jgi:hypothetical protein
VTPPLARRGDAPALPSGATGQPDAAAVTETCLTMAGLRERGWTDAMIRDYLGEPDATRPNPRFRTAAPMKLYLAERADAAEASPEWEERKVRGAARRAAGMAVADRKRAETEAVARQLAADLVASLVFPAAPQRAAIEAYNAWHSTGCTCPGWHDSGFCDKRADASDSAEFLRRITVNHARHALTGYDRAWNQLAGRIGRQDAHEILRSEVNAAIEAKLAAGSTQVVETFETHEPQQKVVEAALGDSR